MADILNVPSLPGMPPLLFGPVAVDAPVALVADALDALAGFGSPVWGVYSQGQPMIVADTVMDLGYSKAFQISDYPVEEGAYQSYNSVETPYEARIRFVSGGSTAVREALLSSVEAIVGDLNLYDIATPERIYINANVTRMEYRRTATEGGASLLAIEVGVQEVRLLSAGSSFNPSDTASANPTTASVVQSQPATPSEMAAAGLTPVTTPAGSYAAGSA